MDSQYVKEYIAILDKLTAVVPLGEDRGEVGSGTPGQTWNTGGGKLRTRSDNEIEWSNQPGNRGKTYPGDAVAQQQAVARETDGQNNLDTAKGVWNRFTNHIFKPVDLGKDSSGKKFSDYDNAKLGSLPVKLPNEPTNIQSNQLPPMASNAPALAQTQANVRNTVAPQPNRLPGVSAFTNVPNSPTAVNIPQPAAAQTPTATAPVSTPTASPASDPKASVAFGKGSAYAAAPDVANDTASPASDPKASVAFGKGNAYAGQPGLAEGDYELEEMRRLAYGTQELDEVDDDENGIGPIDYWEQDGDTAIPVSPNGVRQGLFKTYKDYLPKGAIVKPKYTNYQQQGDHAVPLDANGNSLGQLFKVPMNKVPVGATMKPQAEPTGTLSQPPAAPTTAPTSAPAAASAAAAAPTAAPAAASAAPATGEEPVQEGDDDLATMRRIMKHR